jgi:tetraacyldisaccharide 4'-kinase
LQIKKKFPFLTVAVDKSRAEGCDFLCNPEKLQSSRKARRCKHKDIDKADLIILDDAYQHRSIKSTVSIVLVDYNRPVFKDHLMPMGKLRDLPERISAADIVIVSKCPSFVDAWERSKWKQALGIREDQHIFFTTIGYDHSQAVFPEGDPRYLYTQRLILFSGIANDKPLRNYLSDSYKIVRHFDFPDHHKFTKTDISTINSAARAFPTSVIMTTEKDCQRVRDCKKLSDNLKVRMFYTPIKTEFLSEEEKSTFVSTLKSFLK